MRIHNLIKPTLSFLGMVFDIRDLASLIRRGFGVGSVATVIVSVINWLGDNVPTLSLLLFGLALFFGLMAAMPTILRLFIRHKDGVVNGDKKQLANRIYWREYKWVLDGITKTDPYIELVFTVINAAIFPILVEGIEGRFSVEDEECAQPAEFEGKCRIPHGESVNLRIRQRLSKEMVKLIMKRRESGARMRVDLKSCQLSMQPEVSEKKSEPIWISIGGERIVELIQEI